MGYESYDNDTNQVDKDYFAFVEWLSARAAAELREAKSDPAQQKKALCRYYKRGEQANLTTGELVDFLGVSNPSILEMAGYTEEEGNAVMCIWDSITGNDIRRTALPDTA